MLDTAAPTASTSGFAYVTNSSNQWVPTQLPVDACGAVGCLNTVTTVGTPNTYAAVNPVALGDVMTDLGTGVKPSNQVNEGRNYIYYNIDGTISNSTNRYRVCPRTLRAAPGLVAASSASPYYDVPGSFGVIGTPTSDTGGDTYPIVDGAATIVDVYETSGGVITFGTPTLSPNFDGTQGSTAFNRATTAQTVQVTIPAAAASTSYAILACGYNQSGGVFTAPTGVTGWSAITGGNHSGAGLSTQLYELNPIGASAGQTVNCNTSSAAGTMTAAVWTFKNGPTSGEVVDAIANTRTSTNTTINFPSVTPTLSGDTIFVALLATTASTYSAQPWPYTLGNTSNGQGSIYQFGGTAAASASGSVTNSTTSTADAYAIALKSGITAGTICTAGDKTELQGPASGTQGADLSIAIGGAK